MEVTMTMISRCGFDPKVYNERLDRLAQTEWFFPRDDRCWYYLYRRRSTSDVEDNLRWAEENHPRFIRLSELAWEENKKTYSSPSNLRRRRTFPSVAMLELSAVRGGRKHRTVKYHHVKERCNSVHVAALEFAALFVNLDPIEEDLVWI
jgi:hypothetical protein